MTMIENKGNSLVRRVVVAGVVTSAIGGGLAAIVTGSVARAMVDHNENRQLLQVAREFADEVTEELAEPETDDSPEERQHFRVAHGERSIDNIIVHELEQLPYPSPHAVFHPGALDDAGCTSNSKRRACSTPLRGGLLTLSIDRRNDSAEVRLFGIGIASGALVGGLLGGLASLFLGRWTLTPLGTLRRLVRKVRPDEPDPSLLRPDLPFPEEVEELRRTIEDLIERLAISLSQAQAFATNAAHELRTPLTALTAELDLLIERSTEPDQLAPLKARLARLSTLIQRLLVLATTVEVTHRAEPAIDCSDLVSDVLDELPASQRARVVVGLQEDVVLRGDEELLRVLLANALDNALKYSDGHVELSVRSSAGRASLEVRDSGPGIPAADRERVFVAFERSQSARRARIKGHGVGLALIAHVAKIHGGTASFRDAATGAHLVVELPLWQPSA